MREEEHIGAGRGDGSFNLPGVPRSELVIYSLPMDIDSVGNLTRESGIKPSSPALFFIMRTLARAASIISESDYHRAGAKLIESCPRARSSI